MDARKMTSPYRGFHMGYPGSGKTGAIVSLAKLGYKIRILDFTGNYMPITTYMDDSCDIDIVLLQDKMIDDDRNIVPDGKPTALRRATKLLKEWKYEEDGKEINLGKSEDWGLDTIVVIDELTSMGYAARNRAMALANRTPDNMSSAVWGMAVADTVNIIKIARSKNHHLIINCHKQLLGASDFTAQSGKSEDSKAIAQLINEEIKEMKDEGLIKTRFFPVGPTKNSSQTIHGELPIMLEFEKIEKLGKQQRIIKTEGNELIDTKIPGVGLKKEYPIETGLADIFSALGYKAPKKA